MKHKLLPAVALALVCFVPTFSLDAHQSKKKGVQQQSGKQRTTDQSTDGQTTGLDDRKITGTITDKDGRSITVTGLEAVYWGTRLNNDAELPVIHEAILHVVLKMSEDTHPGTYSEEIHLPFSEIRQISYEPDKSDYKAFRMRIEKRDGSLILLTLDNPRADASNEKNTIEERDGKGDQKRRTKLYRIEFYRMVKDAKGLFVHTLDLYYLRGATTTPSGSNGFVELSIDNIRTIRFK